MATTNGLSQDPLSLLRTSITTEKPPIPTSTPDASVPSDVATSLAQATHLSFNHGTEHVSTALSQSTRFISVASNKAIDLRSIYFCWQNREQSTGDYLNAISALNNEIAEGGKGEAVTNLVFAEKLDLISWLGGESGEEESEFIKSLDDNAQTKVEARDAAATAAGGEDVEMRDAGLSDAAARKREEDRLREIYALERKMGDRNTVLRGVKVQDFSSVRKFSAAFQIKSSSAKPNGAQPAAPLTQNPALRPSVKPGRRAEPIILLSPSASSLLRMPNAKSFLQEGLYQPPESASSTGTNILHLTRTLPSIDSKPMRFIMVDSPDQFRPDYWNRVVAVFTTGQAWQFKNYKWQAPAELFSHVQGVYVGWKGEMIPDAVKGWGRGVLSVQLDKGSGQAQRWRDREVVEEVWSGIEQRMKSLGWGKEGPR
jgi:parafibromin